MTAAPRGALAKRVARSPVRSMQTWVALLRGINVGGNHTLPMAALKALLEADGCADVRTYIQSGNVVFRSPLADAGAIGERVTRRVRDAHGFSPRTLVLSARDFAAAAAGNPFPAADADPKSVHLFFLADVAKAADVAGLDAIRGKTERFELASRVFYLHTPDGFGTSKLAERAERLLGVPATARNWRTVTTLVEMAKE